MTSHFFSYVQLITRESSWKTSTVHQPAPSTSTPTTFARLRMTRMPTWRRWPHWRIWIRLMRRSAITIMASAATVSSWTRCACNVPLKEAETTTNTSAPSHCRRFAATSAPWRPSRWRALRETTTLSAKLTLRHKDVCRTRSSTFGTWSGRRILEWLWWPRRKSSEPRKSARSTGPIQVSSSRWDMLRSLACRKRQPTITRCASCYSHGGDARRGKSSSITSWCGPIMVCRSIQAACSTFCRMLMRGRSSWWVTALIL